MSKEEKNKLKKEDKEKENIMENRVNKFNEKVDKIKDLLSKKIIDRDYAQEKYNILNNIYNDLNNKDKKIKVPKKEFFKILGDDLDIEFFKTFLS